MHTDLILMEDLLVDTSSEQLHVAKHFLTRPYRSTRPNACIQTFHKITPLNTNPQALTKYRTQSLEYPYPSLVENCHFHVFPRFM